MAAGRLEITFDILKQSDVFNKKFFRKKPDGKVEEYTIQDIERELSFLLDVEESTTPGKRMLEIAFEQIVLCVTGSDVITDDYKNLVKSLLKLDNPNTLCDENGQPLTKKSDRPVNRILSWLRPAIQHMLANGQYAASAGRMRFAEFCALEALFDTINAYYGTRLNNRPLGRPNMGFASTPKIAKLLGAFDGLAWDGGPIKLSEDKLHFAQMGSPYIPAHSATLAGLEQINSKFPFFQLGNKIELFLANVRWGGNERTGGNIYNLDKVTVPEGTEPTAAYKELVGCYVSTDSAKIDGMIDEARRVLSDISVTHKTTYNRTTKNAGGDSKKKELSDTMFGTALSNIMFETLRIFSMLKFLGDQGHAEALTYFEELKADAFYGDFLRRAMTGDYPENLSTELLLRYVKEVASTLYIAEFVTDDMLTNAPPLSSVDVPLALYSRGVLGADPDPSPATIAAARSATVAPGPLPTRPSGM
ncbi:MAG TPA: hypothetical protein VNC84_00485 [Gammaproteobacteria bacterium]|jgi:hypothetical protein|nr:hypothetical protein [Gammaproteobacteria bacterium]